MIARDQLVAWKLNKMAATLQKVQELLSTHQSHQPSVLTFQHEVEVLLEDIGKIKSKRL